MTTTVSYFTLDMAVEYLRTGECAVGKNKLRSMCANGEFAGAVRNRDVWQIPQTALEDLIRNYAAFRAEIREHRRQCLLAYYREHKGQRGIIPTRFCQRCEIAENVGPDGLCPQCREELAGAYRWYPLPSRVVAAEYEYRPAF